MTKKNKHQSNAAKKKQQQRQLDAKTRIGLQRALQHDHQFKPVKHI